MSLDNLSPSPQAALGSLSRRVVLSPWVNELFPAWEQLLSARDVARLTRRPHWVLSVLAALGRFPEEVRFRGRNVGWRRSEIAGWLATCRISQSHHRRRVGDHCSTLRFRRSVAPGQPRSHSSALPARPALPGVENVTRNEEGGSHE
jgi:predicted DNA-binding transcriptional regulator AlpA